MKHCTHADECRECFINRVAARCKNELRSEIAEKLGVSHLKGTPQLEAALRRLEQLLLIEEIAALAERDGLIAHADSVANH
jgi:hypothetical protein